MLTLPIQTWQKTKKTRVAKLGGVKIINSKELEYDVSITYTCNQYTKGSRRGEVGMLIMTLKVPSRVKGHQKCRRRAGHIQEHKQEGNDPSRDIDSKLLIRLNIPKRKGG